jgi:hypothetical protein
MLGQQNKVLLRQRWQKSPQHAAFNSRSLQLSSICLVLITITFATFSLLSTPPQLSVQSSALNRFANNEFLLECLQVTPPVAVPPTACRQTLMVHTFAFSYGQPFVGTSSSSSLATLLRMSARHWSIQASASETYLTYRCTQPTRLRIQPHSLQLHCHFRRTTV